MLHVVNGMNRFLQTIKNKSLNSTSVQVGELVESCLVVNSIVPQNPPSARSHLLHFCSGCLEPQNSRDDSSKKDRVAQRSLRKYREIEPRKAAELEKCDEIDQPPTMETTASPSLSFGNGRAKHCAEQSLRRAAGNPA